jgi:hypothetical protein
VCIFLGSTAGHCIYTVIVLNKICNWIASVKCVGPRYELQMSF